MRFNQLITPSPIPGQWAHACDAGRLPGAVLLTGPEGSELLPLALSMVTYLQCSNRLASAEPEIIADSCGTCKSCLEMATLSHPDVLFSYPVTGAGNTSAEALIKWREEVLANPYLSHTDWLQAQTSDNKQGNINKDEVMRILHHLSLTRFSDDHKVVMIWGADYLAEESNRLLKVIEEPPADTLILLVTSRIDRILPTISSRCQLFRLSLPGSATLAEALTARGTEPALAQQLAYTSGGNIGDALTASERIGSEGGLGPDLAAWLRDCFTGKGAAITKASAELAALTREQQKHFLVRSLRFTREMGVVCAGSPRPLMLGAAEAEVAHKLASLLSWPQLTELAAELEHLLQAVERNANGKIAFTAASIRIHHILAQRRKGAHPQALRRAS